MKLKFYILFLPFAFCSYSCTPDKIELKENESPQLEQNEDFFGDGYQYYSGLGIDLDSVSSEQASLGRLLFYDTRLSKNNLISCASCHKQNLAFSDNKRNSPGFEGELTLRNSIALVNVGFQPSIFWDVSGNGLKEDVLKPITNHIEMGIESLEELEIKLIENTNYLEQFEEVFGDREITEEKIGRALSQFVAALISYRSKYDLGTVDNFNSFNTEEKTGKDLFFGKALCSRCHNIPFFAGDREVAVNIGLDLMYEDQGNGNGKFKVPTLRNIELSGPYMHDGRFSSLSEVVQHYDSEIEDHDHLSAQLRDPLHGGPVRLNLTIDEKEALVSFLQTLTDWEFINDSRFSNPN